MQRVLEGVVVLVTGGGNGIGRACALAAAQAGAKVMVNDLGGAITGGDIGSAEPARLVADEIVAGGGIARSNSDSITDMGTVQAMVADTVAAFGALHAVINPAGILRDGMFHKMADADWDKVIEVHLRGAYNIARATAELFRQQQNGAYVFFTSTSGLIGSIGQSNYAAAKMGVAGLSRVLAMEGAARGVRSNVIAPFAWTRMIDSVPIRDEETARQVERFRTGMRPDQVAQLAVALATPRAAGVTGQIFGARGNEVMLFSQPRPLRTISRRTGWTPESLLEEGFPELTPDLYGLESTADLFSYDPV